MKVISVLLICVGLFLISRLYFLQVINGEELTMKADRQYVRPNQSVFDRGAIFFNTKDGERIPAATLKTGYIIFINPTRIDDPENVYLTLRNYINISKEDFMEKASKEDDPYEEIADKVDKDTADKIISLHIDGVQASKERWRYYPGGEMAAQTLGIIAYSGDELAGRYGLERSYEQTLSRKEGNVYVNFFAEIFSNLRDVVTYSEDKEGDVITTIEPNVQAFLEQKLQETLVAYDAQEVGGIVIDPKTGKVTALGSLPSFDPNNFSGESLSIFVNPLVENVYEMGSIMKPLTVAAGLDAGVITPETTYDDKGYLVLNGSRIENYDGKGRGVVPMQEILNQSLNTGVSFIASKLGNDVFSEYMFKYGLGEASGIDLPNDTKGLTDNLIDRCKSSGFKAMCLTVDTVVAGNRERDHRWGFTTPPKLTLKSLMSFAMHPMWAFNYLTNKKFELSNVSHWTKKGSSIAKGVMDYINEQYDPAMSWKDAEYVVKKWGGPFALKGVMSVEDKFVFLSVKKPIF